jgi:hypothetical protein
MTPGWTRTRRRFSDIGRTVATVALFFTMFAAPVAAQTGPQIDLYGYVAPRCWVTRVATVEPLAEAQAPRARVICNQATPALRSQVRALNPDGTLSERRALQPTSGQQSGRTALEIIVSPQL